MGLGSEEARNEGRERGRREGARERGSERGSEGARERGSEGARERGSEAARERGSEAARQRGSEGARERGREKKQIGERCKRGGAPEGGQAPCPGTYQFLSLCRMKVYTEEARATVSGPGRGRKGGS